MIKLKKFFLASKLRMGVLLFLLTLCIPFPSNVVEEWHFNVVDQNNNPVVRCRIRQLWQHSGVEGSDHLEDQFSDTQGHAEFPRRVVYASVLRRILYPVWQTINYFPHQSTNISTGMIIWDERYMKPDDHEVERSGVRKNNVTIFRVVLQPLSAPAK